MEVTIKVSCVAGKQGTVQIDRTASISPSLLITRDSDGTKVIDRRICDTHIDATVPLVIEKHREVQNVLHLVFRDLWYAFEHVFQKVRNTLQQHDVSDSSSNEYGLSMLTQKPRRFLVAVPSWMQSHGI